ncbi:MAG: DUF2834 domain-containing protein [Spirulinaceae cyanobacterium]
MKKIGFGLLWLGFVIYAFIFAPPQQADTFELITKLSTGEWDRINPLIIALFNLMGIWPLIYGCILFIDGRGQKIPAWPFVTASFGVGAFAILPYLALRQANPQFPGEKNWFLQLQDSRWLGLGLTLAAATLLIYGLSQGDWSDFLQQWQTSRFINVMSLDFCLLGLVLPALLKDDLARRGIESNWIFWAVSLLPLIGALAYLCLRPPLEKKEQQSLKSA